MDLLLRPIFHKAKYRFPYVAIPVVVDLLLRRGMDAFHNQSQPSRNPCCSGPTASTNRGLPNRRPILPVAIPVVVDLLLRR